MLNFGLIFKPLLYTTGNVNYSSYTAVTLTAKQIENSSEVMETGGCGGGDYFAIIHLIIGDY
jgi:hypothetical protein